MARRTITSYTNMVLENSNSNNWELQLKKHVRFFECQYSTQSSNKRPKMISRVFLKETITPITLEFKQVNKADLSLYRDTDIPMLILKKNSAFFITKIPKELNLLDSEIGGVHQCSSGKKICQRLSAASDEDGGCEKVRNNSQYIEDYPWIEVGLETINTPNRFFKVIICHHFTNAHPPRQMNPEELENKKNFLKKYCEDYL